MLFTCRRIQRRDIADDRSQLGLRPGDEVFDIVPLGYEFVVWF
jgi:hypothetical protein